MGAYLPEVPGVGVVGDDRAEALQLLRRALRWQVEAMVEDALALPEPSDAAFEVYVAVDTVFIARPTDERLRDKLLVGEQNEAPYISIEKRVPTLRISAPVTV
ncbi:MAG: type II toxin-antitoxin system HicB family antitoxin [Candidatus Cybelea sp.]